MSNSYSRMLFVVIAVKILKLLVSGRETKKYFTTFILLLQLTSNVSLSTRTTYYCSH